jgi:hypothetical protein
MECSSLGHSFQGIACIIFYSWRGWHTSLGHTFSCAHGLGKLELMVLGNNTWFWHGIDEVLTTLALLPRVHFTWRYFIICWVVEVVTWHSFLGTPLLGALSSLLHGYFSYTCHLLTFIGECPHLFDFFLLGLLSIFGDSSWMHLEVSSCYFW